MLTSASFIILQHERSVESQPSVCLETGANKSFRNTASTELSKADAVKAHVHLSALFISACRDVAVISMLTPCATSQNGILGG